MDERNHLCPNCQTLLIVPEEYWRREMRREECGESFTPNETNLQPIAVHQASVEPSSMSDSARLSNQPPGSPASKNLYFIPDGKTVEGPIPATQVMRRIINGMLSEKVLVTIHGEPENWMPFSKTPYFHAAYTVVTAEREAAKPEKKETAAEEGKPDGCRGCIIIILIIVVFMIIVAVTSPPSSTSTPPPSKSLDQIMKSGKSTTERNKDIEKWLRQNRPDLNRKE